MNTREQRRVWQGGRDGASVGSCSTLSINFAAGDYAGSVCGKILETFEISQSQ